MQRFARQAFAPLEKFLAIEAASGILLLVAAAAALVWANSPWSDSYRTILHLPLGVRLGRFAFERDVHFWINDGVMTIFFFVVGLEIRREIHQGELSAPKRAALPLAAAVGGMFVPAGIFIAVNHGHAASNAWGIPMATDIAFAVGALTLLGNRVPAALRVLLLALAVIDDVGAILVIALFYSTGIVPLGLLVAAGGIAAILGLQALGLRRASAYVIPSVVVWAGTLASGVHPTLAGVAVGLLTPVRVWVGREDESPLERIEHALHGWVAFGAMPLFALANSGVALGDASLSGEALFAFLGIVLGLVLGKPLGVVTFSWLASRLRAAELPQSVTWSRVGLVGGVAGIGFTMSMFIAELALPPGELLETSKIAILVGSALAALGSLGAGSLVLRPAAPMVQEATQR